MINPMMMCSYRYSCIDLPVALVYCQVEGCSLRLQYVCQEKYVVLNYIGFDGAERNICRYFFEKLWGWDKS